MVQEYLLDRCRYLAGSLKPFIYLLPKETTRIDYLIDNYKCEVRQIIYDTCFKIEGFAATLNVTESIDNRLDFSTSVTLSMREKWDEKWITFIKELKDKNCYVVVEDYNGTQYIQSPEFFSAFTYSYTFNTNEQGNIAQLTYNCDCNMPVIILDTNIEATKTYGEDCAYQKGGIINFKMIPYQYAFINNDEDTCEFSEITCTDGEALHKIEFIPETFQFRQQFDGRNYQETLVFRIPLSDYKYYFRYNLVEFKENRYAIVFQTLQGYWVASGFEFGFEPTYTVETSDSVDELNYIEITLQHVGQNSIFYCEDEPEVIESLTEYFIPVTQPIKDPITGLELQYWHCVSKTESIYTLIQMVTMSGTPTDKYKCLEGYEQVYANLNIIGTYTASTTFDFQIRFNNSECAIKDNCKFEKMTKDVYTFAYVGQYYDVVIKNPCNWTLNDIPSWLNCSQLSGDGGIEYTVRFTSRQNASNNRIVAYGTLQSFDNVELVQFVLENRAEWINPIEHHITAKKQTISSYIDADFNDYYICGYPPEVKVEKVNGTSQIRMTVEENPSFTQTRSYVVRICKRNGDVGQIYIYQDHLYRREVEALGFFICVDGTSYKKILVYKGYTPDDINILTDETIIGDKLIENDFNCQFENGTIQYRWNTNTGETICQGADKYAREDYEVSNDGGQTWTKTGEYRIGQLIEASSSDCVDIQYKWVVDYTRWICVDTTSYYYEVKYESTDGENWIKTEPEEIQPSQEIRLEEDTDCGWSDTTYRWVDDGDNYICDY